MATNEQPLKENHMLIILNREQNAVGILDNTLPKACPYYNDILTENIENNLNTFEFEIPADHSTSELLKVEGYILYTDLDFKKHLFAIKEIIDTRSETRTKKVYCEHSAVDDLIGNIIRPIEMNSYSIRQATELALQNTGWEVGFVTHKGVADVHVDDYMTSLAVLNEITIRFDIEMEYQVIFDGAKVTRKLINMVDRKGRETGKIFEYTKDLVNVERVEDSKSLVTALLGIGKNDKNGNPLTFKTYNAPADNRFEKINDYIVDNEAFQLFNHNGKHIFGVFKDDQATNSVELYNNTKKRLEELSKPILTFNCSVITLERLTGYGHERVRIGDTIVVKDWSFNPALILEARVVELKRSKVDPTLDSVTLGDYIPIQITQNATLERLQRVIFLNEEQWKASKETIDNIEVGAYNFFHNSNFANEFEHYTIYGTPSVVGITDLAGFKSAMYAINTENVLSGVQVLDFITNPNDWLYKKFTLSLYARFNNVVSGQFAWETFNAGLYYQIRTADGTVKWHYPDLAINATGTSSDWDRYEQEIVFDGDGEAVEILDIRFKAWLENATGEIWVTGLQLESGNIMTSWRPNDEDALELSYPKEEGQNLNDTVSEIDNRTTTNAIIGTVVYSEDFDSIMTKKANYEDLNGLATGEELNGVKGDVVDYVDGRIDGDGGVNESINKVASDLTRTANEINAKFTSSGGVNLIRNSIGFADFDFWEMTGTVNTIRNLDLEQLGFGSGFTHYPDIDVGYIEQTINTSKAKDYSISFWLKKEEDVGTDSNAGVEIYANDVLVAFIGKLTGETTTGYELGTYSFSTEYSEIKIRVTFGANAEAIISGLMLNVGDVAFQWQHHPEEIANTNIVMNMNGIKVINKQTNGHTLLSPNELSGYAEILDENNQPVMERIFTLNGDTTEVSKLDAEKEINMSPIKIVPISSTNYNGWAFIGD